MIPDVVSMLTQRRQHWLNISSLGLLPDIDVIDFVGLPLRLSRVQ